MSLSTFFSWTSDDAATGELPALYPIALRKEDFINVDLVNIYSKILTDVVERTHGLKDESKSLLWDNCVMSESSDGLITLLCSAMADQKELFLVYKPALKVIRKATSQEQEQIKADYQKAGKSSVGIFISFKKYHKSEMLKLYADLEYCTIDALNKSLNLSKALQFKMSDLRGSVSLSDSTNVKAQAKAVADSLSDGKNVLLDAKDNIITQMPDLAAVENAMRFIDQKRSFYLGMPASYINGIAPKGLGDTGEGDAKSVERGLKSYYDSIIKPVLEAIFDGTKVTFKSDNSGQIASSLEALKTFDITSDELISAENKLKIINTLFDLPEDSVGDAPEPVEVVASAGGFNPKGATNQGFR